MVAKERQINTGENTISEAELDRKIIERIKNGETKLFAEIVDKYQKKIMILTSRFIYNKYDVDDAVQEIFIKIYDTIDKFKFKSSFGTWVYRISINYCFELRRKQSAKKNSILFVNYEDCADKLISDSKTSEQILEDKELAEQMKHVINTKLSEKQKAVFMLKYLDDLTVKEIAYVLKMGEGTVKTHLSRSYEKIREVIGKRI